MEFEKKKKLQQQAHHIMPEDIILDAILTRLPAKSLVRFRLVCKSWKHRFSTSEFVKAHFTRQQSVKDQDLLIAHRHRSKYSGYPGAIIMISRDSEIPVTARPWCSEILLGSINGLVCMASGNNFCLWNLAIGQVKDICFPSRCSKDCLHLLGFSWDHVGDDYKVVIVCLVSGAYCCSSTRHLYIYSCKSACWTQHPIPINVVPNNRVSGLQTAPCTIVKGLPYWSCWKYHESIYVFKYVAEKNDFRSLPCLEIQVKEFNLVNSNDHLQGMVYEKGCLNCLVDVYSLDDESDRGVWSKIYTIESINNWNQKSCLSQCFKNGGQVLIVEQDGPNFGRKRKEKDGPLFSYDPKTKETKFVKSTRYEVTRCYSYTPSLVCVQGMESIVLFSSQEIELKKLAAEYSNLVRRSGSISDSSDTDSGTSSDSDAAETDSDSDAETDSNSDAETNSDSGNSSRSDSDADEAQY